jgi:hypothetical protein
MKVSKTMMVLVLGMEAFFCACKEPGESALKMGETQFVQYPGGTWVYRNGKKYDMRVQGNYLIFEEVK